MIEVTLEELASDVKEATINYWFYEEGDSVEEGEDLVEVIVEGNALKLAAPCSGILNEVYFTEGDSVSAGDVLCEIEENKEG
ncbi:MAG: hypothetical protein A3G87_05430 [Omnitrophica bacterium RIFCSPLOWO2_12_FULL_50_11]|nr:MAG: hypothetical protein A3G87_05430 [Omnitrophica bacterium RIFCSPLOWO2_12_FULL_50_11]